MRIKGVDEAVGDGRFMLIYSETGVGKSTSCFQSLPLPILYMCAEMRNAELSAKASGRPLTRGDMKTPNDYVLAEYTNWPEFIEFIAEYGNFTAFKSIVLDGLTQLMMNLAIELEKQAWDAMDKDKKRKQLILEAKLSQEGYGALAAQMGRAIPHLGRLTQMGKVVVINALLAAEENKWEGRTQAYPALMGKKFGDELPGALDFIGMATKTYDKDGRLMFPPIVKFESDGTENFESKWTGPRVKIMKDGKPFDVMQMPLDFNIILGTNAK